MRIARRGLMPFAVLLPMLFAPAAKARQNLTASASSVTAESGESPKYSPPESVANRNPNNYVKEGYRRSPFGKVAHYASTHKELLAADGLQLAAGAAAAASSVHCQRYRAYCIETNDILGPHPSELSTWSYAMGVNGAVISLQHLAWHYAPTKQDRHVIWFTALPISISEAMESWDNAESAERIQRCFKSGLCK
jgi:hypothetical protein